MPTPTTVLLIGAAAALGYYAVTRRRAATPEGQPSPSGGGGTTPSGNGGGGGGGGGGSYIGGDPNYSWPHKDKFPSKASLYAWLQSRGYAVDPLGTNPLSSTNRAGVGHFQNDFNTVREYLIEKGWQVNVNKLDVDGLLGDKSINGIWNVDATIMPQASQGATWRDVVNQALES